MITLYKLMNILKINDIYELEILVYFEELKMLVLKRCRDHAHLLKISYLG